MAQRDIHEAAGREACRDALNDAFFPGHPAHPLGQRFFDPALYWVPYFLAPASYSSSLKRVPVWVIDSDGGSPTVLIEDGWAPAWSPDGTLIAFCRERLTSYYNEIYLARSDGTDIRRLTLTPSRGVGDVYPDWSPDGDKISFARDGLYVMRSDGTSVARVADTGSAIWSEESDGLAFTRHRQARAFGRKAETTIAVVSVARYFDEAERYEFRRYARRTSTASPRSKSRRLATAPSRCSMRRGSLARTASTASFCGAPMDE